MSVAGIAGAMWQLTVKMVLEASSGWAVKHTVVPMMATVTTAYLAFYISIRGTVSLSLCFSCWLPILLSDSNLATKSTFCHTDYFFLIFET